MMKNGTKMMKTVTNEPKKKQESPPKTTKNHQSLIEPTEELTGRTQRQRIYPPKNDKEEPPEPTNEEKRPTHRKMTKKDYRRTYRTYRQKDKEPTNQKMTK